jgi:hypothetical protein
MKPFFMLMIDTFGMLLAGQGKHSWRKRFFVLQGRHLLYFKDLSVSASRLSIFDLELKIELKKLGIFVSLVLEGNSGVQWYRIACRSRDQSIGSRRRI